MQQERPDHFDAVAERYDRVFKEWIVEHYLRKRCRLVLRFLRTGSRVLDVGCGTGMLAEALAKAGLNPLGVDPSHGMLRQAGLRRVAGTQATAAHLPFADGTFDGTVTFATLHHLRTPELVRRCLSEMVRVTRSGGVVIVSDHNPLNPYWRFLMKRVPQDCGDERLVSMHEILGIFSKLPVCEVRNFRSGWVPEFVPRALMPLARNAELFLDATPILRTFSAHNYVVAVRR